MKIHLLGAFLLLLPLAVPAAETTLPTPPELKSAEAVIARWDFRDGKPDSTDGKIAGVLRGPSTIVAAGNGHALKIASARGGAAAGLATARIYPELTPGNAFKIMVSFYLNPPDGAGSAVLLDNKYVNMPKAGQEKYHRGYQINLYSNGASYCIECFWGFGDKTANTASTRMPLAPNAWHTAAVEFTGQGQVRYAIDGKDAGGGAVPAGSLAKPDNRLIIGDRVGNGYQPFPGLIGGVLIVDENTSPAKPENQEGDLL